MGARIATRVALRAGIAVVMLLAPTAIVAAAPPAPAPQPPAPAPQPAAAPAPSVVPDLRVTPAAPPGMPEATAAEPSPPAPLVSREVTDDARTPAPVYKRWWFWTAIAVLAVAGTVLIMTQTSQPAPPDTLLGDMRAF